MHLAVLAAPESWYLRDIQRAAAGRHDIAQVSFRRLQSSVASGGGEINAEAGNLAEFDAVLVRTMPPGSLEQVIFRMDALGRLEAAGTPVINPPRAIEAAVDKYLATCRLAEAGLTVPPTIVCQTAEEAIAAFARLGGEIVLKPIFGAEGRGIARLCDEALALRAFKMIEQLGGVLYLQRYIAHEGCDLRLLVIGQRVLAIRRHNPHDWRTNVSRGATAEPLEVTEELARIAHAAARAVGAPVAGVDLLPGRDGVLYAIEVNAVPGWKALAAALRVDVAALVLEYVESVVRGGRVS